MPPPTRKAEYLDDKPQAIDHIVHPPLSIFNSPDELVASYGITTAPIKLAHNVEEASTIANELGFPVGMKIASPDILHKSDVGGVLLDIKDMPSLQSGYTLMMSRIQSVKPDAKIEGGHLQRQIPAGQEVIVGEVHDPLFGPLMMFGSGRHRSGRTQGCGVCPGAAESNRGAGNDP